MSKKLLYFLAGFLIPFMIFKMAYAEQCPYVPDSLLSEASSHLATWQATTNYSPSLHYVGTFSSSSEVGAAISEQIPAEYSQLSVSGSQSLSQGTLYYEYVDRSYYAECYWGIATGTCPDPPPDTDGDGLPDQYDRYPNDPTPYSVKLTSYQTSDNTKNGPRVRECYLTDRNDQFCIGAAFDDTLGDQIVLNSAWKDPLDLFGDSSIGDGTTTDPESTEGSFKNPDVTNNIPTGDAPSGTDPSLESGNKSTGTETDNEALKGIMDNTGDVAKNTKRLGEYMNALNSAIQNMERNSIARTTLAQKDDVDKAAQESEAKAEKNAFKNFDVEGAIGDKITPTITEGEDGDYQDHGALADETWVQEFIDANPISAVLDQSGFQYSNASSTANLNLGYLGSHTIDLSPLEAGFIAFGNLLVALVTLTGLIHVITGRGF